MFYLDKDLLAPNVLRGKYAPNTDVEIDWGNPITRNLISASLPIDGRVTDIVNGVHATVGANCKIVGTEWGLVGETDGTDSTAGIITFIDKVNGFEGQVPHTIVTRFYKGTNEGANRYICSQRGPDYRGMWALSHGVQDYQIHIAVNQGDVSGTSVYSSANVTGGWTGNNWWTCSWSHDGASGTYVYVYKDGLLVDSTTLLSTAVADFDATANDVSFIGTSRETVTVPPGKVQYLYLFTRVLSAAEHYSIATDPYQIFRPKV